MDVLSVWKLGSECCVLIVRVEGRSPRLSSFMKRELYVNSMRMAWRSG